jgi:hypothetical protein
MGNWNKRVLIVVNICFISMLFAAAIYRGCYSWVCEQHLAKLEVLEELRTKQTATKGFILCEDPAFPLFIGYKNLSTQTVEYINRLMFPKRSLHYICFDVLVPQSITSAIDKINASPE